LFQNSIFKIVVLSLVVYSSNRDPKFAVLMAIVFTITLTMVDQQKIFENFSKPKNIKFKLDDICDPDDPNCYFPDL